MLAHSYPRAYLFGYHYGYHLSSSYLADLLGFVCRACPTFPSHFLSYLPLQICQHVGLILLP